MSGRTVRTPEGYLAFVPDPLPPELTWTPELVRALSDADRSLGRLAGESSAPRLCSGSWKSPPG